MPRNDAERDKHEALVRRFLKLGDTLTHTGCMGIIEEHLYTGDCGRWLCGKPTKDTRRLGGREYAVDDISPNNVTHINRVPVDVVEFLAEHNQYSKEKQMEMRHQNVTMLHNAAHEPPATKNNEGE